MAHITIESPGDRSDVLATAYAVAVRRHGFLRGVDLAAATLAIAVTRPTIDLDVTVIVRVTEGDGRTQVEISSRVERGIVGRWDAGMGSRAVRRFAAALRAALDDPVGPVGAFAPAGWYPDPSGRRWRRYWDGTRWTPWAWRWPDGAVIDEPHAGRDLWCSRLAEPDRDGLQVVMAVKRTPWLPPALRRASVVPGTRVPTQMRRATRVKAAIAIGPVLLTLALVAVVTDLADGDSYSTATRSGLPEGVQLPPGFTIPSDLIAPKGFTPPPIGGSLPAPGGGSVVLESMRIVPPDAGLTTPAYDFFLEVCSAEMQFDASLVDFHLETPAGTRYPVRADVPAPEPAFPDGPMRTRECRAGYVRIAVDDATEGVAYVRWYAVDHRGINAVWRGPGRAVAR